MSKRSLFSPAAKEHPDGGNLDLERRLRGDPGATRQAEGKGEFEGIRAVGTLDN